MADRDTRISGVWPPQGTTLEALVIALGAEVRKGRAEQLATHADVTLIKAQNESMGNRMGIAEARIEAVEEGLATVEQKMRAREKAEEARELDVTSRRRRLPGRAWPLSALIVIVLLGLSTVALAAILLLRS